MHKSVLSGQAGSKLNFSTKSVTNLKTSPRVFNNNSLNGDSLNKTVSVMFVYLHESDTIFINSLNDINIVHHYLRMYSYDILKDLVSS